MKSHRHKKRIKSRDFLHFIPLWIFLKCLAIFPFKLVGKIGYLTGIGVGILFRPRYRVAYQNLVMAYGSSKSKKEILFIIFKAYGNLGRVAAECSWMTKLNTQNIHKYFTLKGAHHFKNALDKGTGVIFLTAHFSNWEIMAVAHTLIWDISACIIAKHIKNRFVDKLLEKYRTKCGNKIVYKERAIWQSLKVLKAGGVLGILMDQYVSSREGISVHFFGIPTTTIQTIALLSLRTESSVIPVSIYPDKKSTYTIEYDAPVILHNSGDTIQDIRVNTEHFNEILENRIRKNPHLWLWMHKRWRSSIPYTARANA